MAVPTAPSTPKSSQRPPSSKSVRQAQKEGQGHLLNPKELFERALQGSDKEKQDGGTPEKGESLLNHSGALDGRIHNTSGENRPPGISAKTVKALVDEDIGGIPNGRIRYNH